MEVKDRSGRRVAEKKRKMEKHGLRTDRTMTTYLLLRRGGLLLSVFLTLLNLLFSRTYVTKM